MVVILKLGPNRKWDLPFLFVRLRWTLLYSCSCPGPNGSVPPSKTWYSSSTFNGGFTTPTRLPPGSVHREGTPTLHCPTYLLCPLRIRWGGPTGRKRLTGGCDVKRDQVTEGFVSGACFRVLRCSEYVWIFYMFIQKLVCRPVWRRRCY